MDKKPASQLAPEKLRAYSPAAKVFHWLTVLLILFQFLLAAMMTDFDDFGLGIRLKGYMLHKSLGFCILILSIIRLDWRAIHPAPPLPSALPLWEKKLSYAVHAALYLMLILLPITGWLLVSTTAYDISFFGLFDIPRLPIEESSPLGLFLTNYAEDIHGALGSLFLVLIVGHIGAALWHHFWRRDGILMRMAPRRFLPFLEYLRARDIPGRRAPPDL